MGNYQIGVLPQTEDGKVVLVTSRSGDYWIFPKGRREAGLADHDVAKDEAYEEAGVLGDVAAVCESFRVNSRKADWLHVYPMRVREILGDWPESDERERVVVTPEQAKALLKKDLRAVLRSMVVE